MSHKNIQTVLEKAFAGLIRYQPSRNPKDVAGKPDFYFQAKDDRAAVFVDGCHQHSCPAHKRLLKTVWLRKKLQADKAEDRRVNRKLIHGGVAVFRVWECVLMAHPLIVASMIIKAVGADFGAINWLAVARRHPKSAMRVLKTASGMPQTNRDRPRT